METKGTVEAENKGSGLCLHFKGPWTIDSTFPTFAEIKTLFPNSIDAICFNTEELQDWDSRFLIILNEIKKYATLNAAIFVADGLPSGVQRLLLLASASPEKAPFKPEEGSYSFLETVGSKTSRLIEDSS